MLVNPKKRDDMKKIILMAISACLLAMSPTDSDAKRKKWSRKAKGTAIGAASGAVIGGVAKGGKGAAVGAAVGAGSGYLIGRHKDRKKGRVYR
jgi:uncharacterized protein YcfJ